MRRIFEFSNFRILCNIYLFLSSCLYPVGCLSFVCWKTKYILRTISKIQHISNSFSYDMPATLVTDRKRFRDFVIFLWPSQNIWTVQSRINLNCNLIVAVNVGGLTSFVICNLSFQSSIQIKVDIFFPFFGKKKK